MIKEGMSRRFSKKDIRKDIERQELDTVDEAFDRIKTQVVRDVIAIDQGRKALTGRKFNQYENESGIKGEELFPENNRILNIGDPWQVLDKEGIVNLEYETGEEADFTFEKEIFINSLENELNTMLQVTDYIAGQDQKFANDLHWRIKAVQDHINAGITLDDYLKESKVMYDVTSQISSHHNNDDGAGDSRELWYAAMRLARGFEDVYYTETVIKPRILKENLRKKGISNEEEDRLIKQLIEEYRGQKKYKYAELVKGAFPDTQFEDESFDRVTASWSISAHMFGVMDGGQFFTVWKELDRILKKDGAAYFWPMNWSGPSESIIKSLRDHRASGGNIGYIHWENLEPVITWIDEIDSDDQLTSITNSSETLIFLPKGYKAGSEKRIENSLDEHEDIDQSERLF